MFILNIDPVAFSIGPISVRWYGIMIALAIAVLIFWTLWQVRKGAKLSEDTIFSVALVAIPSAIIVSRLLHVIDEIVIVRLHPELAGYTIDYLSHPELIIGASGLTIWGAVIGATLGIWVYSRFSKSFSFGYFGDVIAPGVVIAQSIGRVGCTLNGCCYGGETSFFGAITYTNPDSFAPLNIPVHPTQIYEIIYLLAMFGLLMGLRKHLKPDGSLFLIYFGLYGLWRFVIGFLRDGTPFLFGLQQAQLLGLIAIAIVVPILVLKTHWVKKEEVS